MAVARYLADTSAYARFRNPAVARVLEPLLDAGLVATCSPVDLELLYSTRTADEHEQVRRERRGFEQLDTEQVDWDRAAQVQSVLASQGRTRAVGIADLLVAAVAERHRVAVLHYDRDFDTIASVTGQGVQWVTPPGSVP